MNVKRIYTPWKIEWFYRFKGLFSSRKKFFLQEPKKILLCNQGALGDVFLTTCMIPALKEKFPEASIGMLIEPASRPAVENCPGVDFIHEKKAWFRPKDSKWKKIQRAYSYKTSPYDYDLAICSFPFYRGIGSALKNIPQRICFETIGDRIYFNRVVSWSSGYIGQQYVRLLKEIGIKNPKLQCPWQFQNKEQSYVIFHIGSADETKEFSLSYWRDLANAYRDEGRSIFFTGSGERQTQMIEKIALKGENVCNRLSFLQFIEMIAHCDHVVTVDTVTLHVAAMLKKPYFALFRKPSDYSLWYPDTKEGACILEN